MNQNQQNLVRIDVTASGDPQSTRKIVALLARTLKERLPGQDIEVRGQDQELKSDLENEDKSQQLEGLNVDSIVLVADNTQQFHRTDDLDNIDWSRFHVPMAATPVSHETSLRHTGQLPPNQEL